MIERLPKTVLYSGGVLNAETRAATPGSAENTADAAIKVLLIEAHLIKLGLLGWLANADLLASFMNEDDSISSS